MLVWLCLRHPLLACPSLQFPEAERRLDPLIVAGFVVVGHLELEEG